MINKYVKRPFVVEAIKFDGSHESARMIEDWGGTTNIDYGEHFLSIITKSGRKPINVDEYVVRTDEGDFASCRSDLFEEVYTLLTGDQVVNAQIVHRGKKKPRVHHLDDEEAVSTPRLNIPQSSRHTPLSKFEFIPKSMITFLYDPWSPPKWALTVLAILLCTSPGLMLTALLMD